LHNRLKYGNAIAQKSCHEIVKQVIIDLNLMFTLLKNFFLTITLLLSLCYSGWAQGNHNEYAPESHHELTFQGYDHNGQAITYITIYAKSGERRRSDYLVSEYNIFPGDVSENNFKPYVSIDYYLNENGLWAQTPYEKSQSIEPCLILPNQINEGSTFVGCGNKEFMITAIAKPLEINGVIYDNALELTSGEGEQIILLPHLGTVLNRGGENEYWLIKSRIINDGDLKNKYKIK
jgi:hypothetical protein